MIRRAAIALAAALGLVATAALGQERDLPDPALTPAVALTADRATICAVHAVPGEACEAGHRCGADGSYSQRHRRTTSEMKAAVLRRYGVAMPFHGEIDHVKPICAGGADVVENLWPQSGTGTWTFHDKDRLETWACRQICHAGTMTPAAAQALFVPDWRVSYCAAFADDPRCQR